jgi:spermidine synthase
MNLFTRWMLFLLFFLSGACSLVYQVVWTRMAFASFGIIMPVLSVVLSAFMSGLAIGSWGGGRWIPALAKKTGRSAIFFYAAIEFLIGLGAFIVPALFSAGKHLLSTRGQTDSFAYLSLSAIVLAGSIFPWCLCMGATFPAMMTYVREQDARNDQSFSFLYLANVLGAMCGVFLTAVILIEMLGFRHTLWVAATGNFLAAIISVGLGRRHSPPALTRGSDQPAAGNHRAESGHVAPAGRIRGILFLTGFVSMAMEVIWTRAFTPVLKTAVYSFAAIVFAYLAATFFGSRIYRHHLRKGKLLTIEQLIFLLAIAAFLPVLLNDSRLVTQDFRTSTIDVKSAFLLLSSICPFCALLGYLTPRLIDSHAAGDPAGTGAAYAVNVLGCILGPLFAGYFLLPLLSERIALLVLAVPFAGICAMTFARQRSWRNTTAALALSATLIWSLFWTEDFEALLHTGSKRIEVRRDYAASVISVEREKKWLVVNGIDMTALTPITKFMVHLPLALHEGPPQSALVICFGMGTSYRSALTWNIDTTAVELVPSVPRAFGFYHADADQYLRDPNGRIIIDDGRRYLHRCGKKFDAIIVDPPPPIQAAGSSLLYSREFYVSAKDHLNPGGILQVWFPGGDPASGQAIARSLRETFPYVRCFVSVEGWGTHFLASSAPIRTLTAGDLANRMPQRAKDDLVEWVPGTNAADYLQEVVKNELPFAYNPNPAIQLTDDKPLNEYFLLRLGGFY